MTFRHSKYIENNYPFYQAHFIGKKFKVVIYHELALKLN